MLYLPHPLGSEDKNLLFPKGGFYLTSVRNNFLQMRFMMSTYTSSYTTTSSSSFCTTTSSALSSSILSSTNSLNPSLEPLLARKKMRTTSKLTEIVPPQTLDSTAKILSLADFKSQFCMLPSCKDVDQGTYKIVPLGKKICTTGVATCVGIIAKRITPQQNITKIGIAHFDGIGPNLSKFLKAMHNKKDRINLHVFGGYRSSIKEHMSELDHAIKQFSNTFLIETFLNPWKTENIESTEIERMMDVAGFSLGVGVTESGTIQLADFTINKLETAAVFCDYKTVMTEFLAMLQVFHCTLKETEELTQIAWKSDNSDLVFAKKRCIFKLLQSGCRGKLISSILTYVKNSNTPLRSISGSDSEMIATAPETPSNYEIKPQIQPLIELTKILQTSIFDSPMLTGRVITTVYDYWQNA